jgi:hypothetical protein
MSLVAECGRCRQMFTANPSYVPSTRTAAGVQLVFCRPCIEWVNAERMARGLTLFLIHPLAYEIEEG